MEIFTAFDKWLSKWIISIIVGGVEKEIEKWVGEEWTQNRKTLTVSNLLSPQPFVKHLFCRHGKHSGWHSYQRPQLPRKAQRKILSGGWSVQSRKALHSPCQKNWWRWGVSSAWVVRQLSPQKRRFSRESRQRSRACERCRLGVGRTMIRVHKLETWKELKLDKCAQKLRQWTGWEKCVLCSVQYKKWWYHWEVGIV